jgi:hypothetical protein
MSRGRNGRATSRRAFLRGTTGAILALPALDFAWRADKLVAAPADAVAAGAAPVRFFTMFFPNGAAPELFNYQSALGGLVARGVAPLATTVVNLANPAARGGPFDNHGNGGATVFTGERLPDGGPKVHVMSGDQDTDLPQVALQQAGGPTADQFAAARLGDKTLLRSLVFGTMQNEQHHVNMFGRHAMCKSWAAPDKPIENVRTPLAMFDRIFGPEWESAVNSGEVARADRASVIDTVMAQYKTVTTERYGLSPQGRARLDEHLTSLSELEKKVKAAAQEGALLCPTKPTPPAASGADLPYDAFDDNFRLQTAVLIKAFECDLVRFGHIAFGGTAQYYSNVGFDPARKSGHVAAHEKNKPLYNLYVTHYMNLFGDFFKQLNEKIEANGKSMLYNSLFYVATDLGDQAAFGHVIEPASVLVVGAAGGRVRFQNAQSGSYYDVGGKKNVNDVLTACMRAIGLDVPVFGRAEYGTGALF